MNNFSRTENRNGQSERKTPAGRATSISVSATPMRRQKLAWQPLRPCQKPEQHEHRDLGKPGRGIEKGDDRSPRPRRTVADDQARKIDREKSRRVDRLAQSEGHDRAGRNEGCMQPLRQFHAIEKRDDRHAADDSDHRAQRRLAQQHERNIDRRLLALQQDLDQHQREKDRERIVGAGFDLDGRRYPRPHPQSAGMHQEEHGGGVGRGDGGAEEKAFDPVQVERHRPRPARPAPK